MVFAQAAVDAGRADLNRGDVNRDFILAVVPRTKTGLFSSLVALLGNVKVAHGAGGIRRGASAQR